MLLDILGTIVVAIAASAGWLTATAVVGAWTLGPMFASVHEGDGLELEESEAQARRANERDARIIPFPGQRVQRMHGVAR